MGDDPVLFLRLLGLPEMPHTISVSRARSPLLLRPRAHGPSSDAEAPPEEARPEEELPEVIDVEKTCGLASDDPAKLAWMRNHLYDINAKLMDVLDAEVDAIVCRDFR